MKLLKTAAAAAAGVAYGMFFAQKSGKKLREDMSKAKDPVKHLMDELKKMADESGAAASKWVQDSEELQGVLKTGKKQFDSLVSAAKDLSDDKAEELKAQFEELSKNAQKAAKDMEKKAGKVKKDMTKKAASMKKDAGKLKKNLEKEVKTVAKKLKK